MEKVDYFVDKTSWQVWKRWYTEKLKVKFPQVSPSLIQIVYKNCNTLSSFLYLMSYTMETLNTNHSVQHIFGKITNPKIFWILLNYSCCYGYVLHEGFDYSIKKYKVSKTNKYHCIKVSTWKHQVEKSCGYSGYGKLFKKAAKEKKRQNTERKCVGCCKEVSVNALPYKKCKECKGNWHLWCLTHKTESHYYAPKLGELNKNYERPRTFHPHPNNDFVCVICKSKPIRSKMQWNDAQYQYLCYVKKGKKHYFSNKKGTKFYSCPTEKLNSFYLAISRWRNFFVPYNYVCYDQWFRIKILNYDAKLQSLNIMKKIIQHLQKTDKFFGDCWQSKNFDIATEHKHWIPIGCYPVYWKSKAKVGTFLTRYLCMPHEIHVLSYILISKVASRMVYSSTGEIVSINLLKETVNDPQMKALIEKFVQQYDFTVYPNKGGWRTKYYRGYHYTNPVRGNTNQTSKQIHVAPQVKAVLVKIKDEEQEEDPLVELVEKFINCRYQSIISHWITTDMLQINAYTGRQAGILNHYDSCNWFNAVLLMKLLCDSGLSFSCSHQWWEVSNPYLFHPMEVGMTIEPFEFGFTWYKHSKAPWMNQDSKASISAIFRHIAPYATIHSYPKNGQPSERLQN